MARTKVTFRKEQPKNKRLRLVQSLNLFLLYIFRESTVDDTPRNIYHYHNRAARNISNIIILATPKIEPTAKVNVKMIKDSKCIRPFKVSRSNDYVSG